MMIPMTSWSSLGGGGARVSGWKPGGEESPPTGLGLIRTNVVFHRTTMKTMSDGGILPTMCLEIIVTLVPGAMRMIQGVATGLEEPFIIIIIIITIIIIIFTITTIHYIII